MPELAEDGLKREQGIEEHRASETEQAQSAQPPSPRRQRLSGLVSSAAGGNADALAELTVEAETGDALAQHALGLAHSRKDPSGAHPEAVEWFRKAAAQGNLFAVATLSGCYAHGRGVEKDVERGARLMRAAADMGESLSQYNLGNLYRAPGALPTDLVQTYAWFTIMLNSLPESPSVRKPSSRAVMVEGTTKYRDRLAEKMTAAQIAEGERIAAQWRKKTWDEVRDDVQQFL